MNLTDSKLYAELLLREKILTEQLAHFNFGREEVELELSAIKTAIASFSAVKTWHYW